jgi:hypothetical protein
MPINFPSSPTEGQQFVSSNITYYYSTTASGWITTAIPTDSVLTNLNSTIASVNAAFAVANAAYGNANTKLANSTVTLAGSLTTTGSMTDSKGNVRDVPLTTQTAVYALTISDVGNVVSTSANVFVPNAVFTAGHTICVFNNSAATISITGNNVVLRLAGQSNSSNKLLSQNGVVTILCVAANNFVLTGAGLS